MHLRNTIINIPMMRELILNYLVKPKSHVLYMETFGKQLICTLNKGRVVQPVVKEDSLP